MKSVKSKTPEAVEVDLATMPEHESERLCLTVILGAAEFFKNPVNRSAYEKWKSERGCACNT